MDEYCQKLEENKVAVFHNIVSKTLFSTKQARPDTCNSIAFITTRVHEPDNDERKKLVHLVKYLLGMLDLTLTLSDNGIRILKWWVDASYATHGDMRGNTGACMLLGQGAVTSMAKKQKMNTKSSTECKLIGGDDAMPQIL